MLAMLAVVLLSAAPTPAQQQRAAGALYQVLTNYNAEGLFVGAPNEEGKAPMAEDADGTTTLGSAFAISRDGWLITARHVVDPAMGLKDLCDQLSRDWPGSVMLRRATLTRVITDIAGNNYGFVSHFEPATWGNNLCMPGEAFEVSYDETMPARVRALDPLADLALVSIDAGPIVHLDLSRGRPARWRDLFAIGYSDPGERTVQNGSVAIRCEMTEGPCRELPDGTLKCPVVLAMRTTAAVQEGMSGSPQVADGRAVGITTMKSLDAPIGFAIPASYASAWYRHVRWPQKYRRPTAVCKPTPEQ